jgi:hypothetical protein
MQTYRSTEMAKNKSIIRVEPVNEELAIYGVNMDIAKKLVPGMSYGELRETIKRMIPDGNGSTTCRAAAYT